MHIDKYHNKKVYNTQILNNNHGIITKQKHLVHKIIFVSCVVPSPLSSDALIPQ